MASAILIELLPLVSFVKVSEHCLLLESASDNYEIAIDCEMPHNFFWESSEEDLRSEKSVVMRCLRS